MWLLFMDGACVCYCYWDYRWWMVGYTLEGFYEDLLFGSLILIARYRIWTLDYCKSTLCGTVVLTHLYIPRLGDYTRFHKSLKTTFALRYLLEYVIYVIYVG